MTVDELLAREDVPRDVREAVAERLRALAEREAHLRARLEHAERTLCASEERYRRITAAIADYIYSVRVEAGRVLDTHHAEACEAVTGYRSEEYAADPFLWFRMVLPEDRALVEAQARQALAGEDAPPLEHRLLRKDGALRWVRSTIVLHRDSDGHLLSYDGLVADVTERRAAEEALRTSEERYRALVEQSSMGIGISRGNEVVFANPALLRIFGYDTLEEFARIPLLDHVAPASAALIRDRMRRQGRGETLRDDFEYEILRRDGRNRTLFATSSHFTLGGRAYTQTTFQDVTERKRAEEALRESEARYRQLFETESDTLFLIDNETGRILEANTAATETYGYSHDELLALRNTDVSAEPEATRQATTKTAGLVQIPVRWHRRKDGTPFPVEITARHLELGGRPVHIAAIRDISNRFRADEALREREERFRALVETTAEWIWSMDLTGRHTYSNPGLEKILGYRPEELLGTDSMALIHPDDRSRAEALMREKTAARQGWSGVVLRWRHKDGHYRHLESNAVPVLDASGRLCGFQGADRDITERQQAEEERRRLEAQVQHAQKLESLGVLAGGIAHDFNNLLVAVLGNASLAALNLPPDAPARAQLKDVEAAARRASELCNQLLAYSGRGTFIIEPLDPNHLIEEMVSLLRVSISKKVELRLALSGEPLTIDADATQLRQVVLNLVINASEAIGDKVGTITVSTGTVEADRAGFDEAYLAENVPQGAYAYVGVADTGIGIDAETRRKLFDPFFTTKFAGRGLGLSAVLGIVRGHRGAIKVTSEPGRGTAFRVFFPLRTDVGATAPVVRPRPSIDSWRGTGTVLVIDDEPSVRTVTTLILERLGFTALAAADGRAGVEAFRAQAQAVRLVLLDLTMPLLGGQEVLAEIRRVRPDVPVVLMSGYGETEAAGLIADQQVHAFLQKPFDTACLTEALRAALEPGGEAARRAGGTLLLVDDDPQVSGFGKAVLEQLGYTVYTADSGQRALEEYQRRGSAIDLVILDQHMPVMDGLDTFLALRQQAPTLGVLFASGSFKPEIAQRLLDLGVAGFVQKPYTLQQLGETVSAALRRG